MRRLIVFTVTVFCSWSFAATDAVLVETSRRTSLEQESVAAALENCNRSQSDMNTCAEYRYVQADLELNRVYLELAGRSDERDARKLRTAQQAWVLWRDANCDYEASDLEGGSLRPLVSLTCKSRVTGDRSEWVLDMLSCTSVRGECRLRKGAR